MRCATFVWRLTLGILPGPSELLVLADDTANAKFAAADLIAQAEHGSGYERVWLVIEGLAAPADVAHALSQFGPTGVLVGKPVAIRIEEV